MQCLKLYMLAEVKVLLQAEGTALYLLVSIAT